MLQARKLRHVLARARWTYWHTIQMDRIISVAVTEAELKGRLQGNPQPCSQTDTIQKGGGSVLLFAWALVCLSKSSSLR